ncbi:MAG TPA: glycoside hydrolase family 43 protein [Anaerohalosphaeraceae bacterium]|nr:glycoside hydrolase family 43 protein [Anaerohalosphaeraceae bacterium]
MKSRWTLLLCLGIVPLGSSGGAQSTFRNPILRGMNPDPSICRVGEDYYLVTSSFEYFPGLPIYHSKDLVHWKLIGYALTRESQNPLRGCDAGGGQYAATIRCHQGTFYISGTNYGGKGTQGVFYVTAENPAGPWSEPHWLGYWYVDPSLLFEDDVVYYLSPDNKESFLLGILDLKTDRMNEPLKKIASGLGGSSPEGPHLYKIKDYYYLLSAEGGTGYEHSAVIQRSRSPWGPYEASPHNPVASHKNDPDNPFHAIGHADMVETPDGWWMVCLGIRPRGGRYHHLGRETFLAPVSWTEDGWPKIGTDGIVREEYPAPKLPTHLWEKEPTRDDFDSPSLQLVWNFLRNPHPEDWSLTARPGFMRLNGSKISFQEKDSPAFVCRRQTAFNISASAAIEFIPTDANEEAGLVIRGNDNNHYDFVITLRNGKRVILFRAVLQGRIAQTAIQPVPDGRLILQITADALEYRFGLLSESKERRRIASAATKNLSTEVIGGFTGVFIGMYASGNGKANQNPADFDWFDFEENDEI